MDQLTSALECIGYRVEGYDRLREETKTLENQLDNISDNFIIGTGFSESGTEASVSVTLVGTMDELSRDVMDTLNSVSWDSVRIEQGGDGTYEIDLEKTISVKLDRDQP